MDRVSIRGDGSLPAAIASKTAPARAMRAIISRNRRKRTPQRAPAAAKKWAHGRLQTERAPARLHSERLPPPFPATFDARNPCLAQRSHSLPRRQPGPRHRPVRDRLHERPPRRTGRSRLRQGRAVPPRRDRLRRFGTGLPRQRPHGLAGRGAAVRGADRGRGCRCSARARRSCPRKPSWPTARRCASGTPTARILATTPPAAPPAASSATTTSIPWPSPPPSCAALTAGRPCGP